MKETAEGQLALKICLAATAKCVDRMDARPKQLTIAEICPQNAFLLADRLVGESTHGARFRHGIEAGS